MITNSDSKSRYIMEKRKQNLLKYFVAFDLYDMFVYVSKSAPDLIYVMFSNIIFGAYVSAILASM